MPKLKEFIESLFIESDNLFLKSDKIRLWVHFEQEKSTLAGVFLSFRRIFKKRGGENSREKYTLLQAGF